MYEVDAGRDRATPAAIRHDADGPLAPLPPHIVEEDATVWEYVTSEVSHIMSGQH